jgi:hypothetical protein
MQRGATRLVVGAPDAATEDAVLRLARLLETPRGIAVLAPMIWRELR